MPHIKKIIFFIVSLIAIASTTYLVFRWNYADDHNVVPEKKHATDTLLIGIVGDSWVSGHKLDTILFNNFRKNILDCRIISFGEAGASSGLIYRNMFKDASDPFSSNSVFYSNLKYCIIIAGVNDAIGQYGGKYYAYHINLIIRDLLRDHIRPVLVTLPEFGIEDAENSFNIFKRIRNRVFGVFTGNGFQNSIRDYRKTLADDLASHHLDDSIVTVNFDSVLMRYQDNKSLYFNPPHLNLKGNQKLGRYIVKCILADMQKLDLTKPITR